MDKQEGNCSELGQFRLKTGKDVARTVEMLRRDSA